MRVELVAEAIDPSFLLSAFLARCGDRTGAVVSFTGLCRSDPGENGLELEAYPGFTEAAIESFLDQAVQRFRLEDVQAVHRVGFVAPGEPIVFVVAAARHRRAAFQGADLIMDWLKSRAPFWKKAHGAEGGRWIEPRPEDYEDAARWDATANERTPG